MKVPHTDEVLTDEINNFKNVILAELKQEIRDEILNEKSKKEIKEQLRKKIIDELLNESNGNFFNRNPLVTFSIFSIIVIFLFKTFVG